MEQILDTFRSDLAPRTGKGGGFDYSPSVTGLAMGGSPNSKGIWKAVSYTHLTLPTSDLE